MEGRKQGGIEITTEEMGNPILKGELRNKRRENHRGRKEE